ncbi:MAG TPA: phosphoglycerate dehydrogenase [Chloroflexota bacterium]
MAKVLITTPFVVPGGDAHQVLTSAGLETEFSYARMGRTEEELIGLLRGVSGVVAATDPFTARVLEAAPDLRIIARSGVGYDAIDVPAATARGVVVTTNPGVNRHAVAEYAFALMLACSRHLCEGLAEVKGGGWKRFEGIDLAGRTLGIVGLGTIGKEVAQRARAFEMRILAYDVHQDAQFAEEHGVSFASLDQLLRESDFVTIHAFLDSGSRHLIDAGRLALMKPTAYLINTARGGLVDSDALVDALRERRIAGAALDVFEHEPLEAESELRTLDNAYLSPHLAGSSSDATMLSARLAAENVVRVLRGERPHSCVNPEVLS